MADTFDELLADGLATIRSFKGRPVTYFGGDDSNDQAEIDEAVIGRSRSFHRDQQVVEARDFLIESAALVNGDGEPIVPVAGHRIHEERDGVRHIYEIAAEEDQAFWEWSDPLRTVRRIHTIFIKTETI